MIFWKKKKDLPKSVQEFMDKLLQFDKENQAKPYLQRELYPPSTDAQFVVNCLVDVLLGEDWYIVDPLPNSQANTLILDEILYRYCPGYRKAAKGRKHESSLLKSTSAAKNVKEKNFNV